MADGTANGRASKSSGNAHQGLLQFGWRRSLPLFMQTEAGECGLACLAMIAAFLGHDVDLGGLRKRFPSSMRGTTLGQLMNIAARLELSCRPLKLDLTALRGLKVPCILHWDLNHFVVLSP